MKHIFTGFNLIGVIALLNWQLAAPPRRGETQNKEKFLIAAGFKVIVPVPPRSNKHLKHFHLTG
jgi:hypothetical protein